MDDADLSLSTVLLNITLSDSDSEDNQSREATKADRTKQSATAFEALKATYRPKMENGEIWQHAAFLAFPLADPDQDQVHKGQAQTLLHAVEELYFFRRYDEGLRFVDGVLASAPEDKPRGPHADVWAMLGLYRAKCRDKLAAFGSGNSD